MALRLDSGLLNAYANPPSAQVDYMGFAQKGLDFGRSLAEEKRAQEDQEMQRETHEQSMRQGELAIDKAEVDLAQAEHDLAISEEYDGQLKELEMQKHLLDITSKQYANTEQMWRLQHLEQWERERLQKHQLEIQNAQLDLQQGQNAAAESALSLGLTQIEYDRALENRELADELYQATLQEDLAGARDQVRARLSSEASRMVVQAAQSGDMATASRLLGENAAVMNPEDFAASIEATTTAGPERDKAVFRAAANAAMLGDLSGADKIVAGAAKGDDKQVMITVENSDKGYDDTIVKITRLKKDGSRVVVNKPLASLYGQEEYEKHLRRQHEKAQSAAVTRRTGARIAQRAAEQNLKAINGYVDNAMGRREKALNKDQQIEAGAFFEAYDPYYAAELKAKGEEHFIATASILYRRALDLQEWKMKSEGMDPGIAGAWEMAIQEQKALSAAEQSPEPGAVEAVMNMIRGRTVLPEQRGAPSGGEGQDIGTGIIEGTAAISESLGNEPAGIKATTPSGTTYIIELE